MALADRTEIQRGEGKWRATYTIAETTYTAGSGFSKNGPLRTVYVRVYVRTDIAGLALVKHAK